MTCLRHGCYSHPIHLKSLIPITEKEAVLHMENNFKPAQFIDFDAKEKLIVKAVIITLFQKP